MGWDPYAKTVIGVRFTYDEIHHTRDFVINEDEAAKHPGAVFHPKTGKRLMEPVSWLKFFVEPKNYEEAVDLQDMGMPFDLNVPGLGACHLIAGGGWDDRSKCTYFFGLVLGEASDGQAMSSYTDDPVGIVAQGEKSLRQLLEPRGLWNGTFGIHTLLI